VLAPPWRIAAAQCGLPAIASGEKAEADRAGRIRIVPRDADLQALFGVRISTRRSVLSAARCVNPWVHSNAVGVMELLGRFLARSSIDLRTLYLKDLRLIGCTVLEPGIPNLCSIERGRNQALSRGITR
jgi:hypothetical protein